MTITMARRMTFAGGSHRSLREEGDVTHQHKSEHVPVMVKEVVEALNPQKGEIVVDATYGQGGHSRAVQKAAKVRLIALDADPSVGGDVIEANFADIKPVLSRQGITKINKALFDLGWNMGQLKSGRGFSFLHDEPLDMSYGRKPRSGFSAAEVLNTWSEKALADALFGYGEERYARRIARRVVERRALQPFSTTLELVELIRDSTPPAYRHGKLHPATRTFQALRIAVNDELKSLEDGLKGAWEMLECGLPGQGGRIVVITFHSIEDRAVKRFFAAHAKGGQGRLLYKKPLIPRIAEVKANPSARSAKLRAIEKTCEQ